MLDGWRSDQKWVVDTGNLGGTYAIALSFVFLAYAFRPAIETAYRRVRAHRAWRAINNSQTVEITNYSTVNEVFRGRGKWDSARIITVLMAACSLATWGLELELGLAYIDDGPVDLLNRPPPVVLRPVAGNKSADTWQVMNPIGGLNVREGVVPNMMGTYVEGSARSRYHLQGNDVTVDGVMEVARWSDNVEDMTGQFYNVGRLTASVEKLECSSNGTLKTMDLYVDDSDQWGGVVECVHGPRLTSDLLRLYPDKIASPPTIILTRSDGDVHVVVEESSTYPSFLYSVWTPASDTGTSVELNHVFHIASTMRLAEAVVTGIVYGGESATGGGCFALLRQFSEVNPTYAIDVHRASPFGEHPTVDSLVVAKLSQVENIEAGVEIGLTALLCAVWLMTLGSIGFVWSFLLRSRVGMDVYDRDKLIRAVSLQGAEVNSTVPSSMRIFVRKEDTGNVSVVISNASKNHNGCTRFPGTRAIFPENDDSTPLPASVAQQGASIPAGPQTVLLQGIPTDTGSPQLRRTAASVILSASPPATVDVESTAGTLVPSPHSSVDV